MAHAKAFDLAATAIAETDEAFSPLDLVGKTRKRPMKGLLSSTSFRVKLQRILADETLDLAFSPEVTWASAVSASCELAEEVAVLHEEVSSYPVLSTRGDLIPYWQNKKLQAKVDETFTALARTVTALGDLYDCVGDLDGKGRVTPKGKSGKKEDPIEIEDDEEEAVVKVAEAEGSVGKGKEVPQERGPSPEEKVGEEGDKSRAATPIMA